MGIGPDGCLRASLLQGREHAPVEVEPVWISVDLECHVALGGPAHHGIHVERVGIAREQQSPRRMPENGEPWVVQRAQDAGRHLGPVHVEAAVHGADDEVESLQHFRRVVECAVLENVRFHALEHANALDTRVDRVYLEPLPFEVIGAQAPRIRG